MSRLTEAFERLRAEGRKALVGYLTAGDPNLVVSEQAIRTALEKGLDVLEIGVPFSDPTADGPTIQAAAQRALAAGTTLKDVLDMANRLRRDYPQPIVLFGYANPFFCRGIEQVCADAAQAGVDGLLIVDVPLEESHDWRPHLRAHGLDFIPLIAPTTSVERARLILKEATGFVYYIMVRGVTGIRTELPPDVAEHLRQLRTCTSLPLVAGFGVSRAEQARVVARDADGVVVGSALVEAAREGRVEALLRELRAGLKQVEGR